MIDLRQEFSGKVALVTGGSRGIGRAVVLAFARLGCHVTFCYKSDHAAAQAVCDEGGAAGVAVRAVQADVGYSDQAQRFVDDALAYHGRIDVLVNNAGQFPQHSVLETDDAEWERTLRTNLYSVFYCSRAVLPAMMAAGSGAIINVASIAGKRGSAKHPAYATAKGGVLAFTRSLAKEVIARNIRVNAICPGRIATEIFGDQIAPEELARFLREAPIGRLGQPEEVASTIVFLASGASSYVVGETLEVDGGIILD